MKPVQMKSQWGILGVAVAFLFSGCGGAAYQGPTPGVPQSRANPENPYSPHHPNSPDHEGKNQPISTTFKIQGTRGAEAPAPAASHFTLPDVYTDTILSLDLMASEDVTALGTGCVIKSSCLELTVAVFDHDTQNRLGSTQKISAHAGTADGIGACGGEQAHPQFDFSSRLPKNHGVVDLVFNQAKSLVYSNSCYSWDGKIPNPLFEGLYDNYTQEATVTVHVNGTW